MTKTYSMPKDFYWGGASAANQYEGGYKDGGKGLNAVDVLTNGSASEPRKVTWKTADGKTGSTKPAIPIYRPHSSLGITSTIKLNIIGVQRPTP